MTALDNRVRLHVYEGFVDAGRAPTVDETAEALGVSCEAAAASFERLQRERVLVLAPGTASVWMAQPFSAVPTSFSVQTAEGSFWGNCVWDALGIVAMLGGSGRVVTSCADCGDPLELVVEDGELAPVEAVAHFVVPAASWWENVGYT